VEAAKAADQPTLQEVMERLLIRAVIAGADEFEKEAAAADARETNDTTTDES